MAHEPKPQEKLEFRQSLSERAPSFSPDVFAAEGCLTPKRVELADMRLYEVASMTVHYLVDGADSQWRVGELAAFVEQVRNRFNGNWDNQPGSLQSRKAADPELHFAGMVEGILMVLTGANNEFQEQEDETYRKKVADELRPHIQAVAAANNGHVSAGLLNRHLMETLHPELDPKEYSLHDMISRSQIISDMLSEGTLILGNRNVESEYFELVADPVGRYEI